VAERSPERAEGPAPPSRSPFSRAGLGVALSLVVLAAALAAFGAARLRGGPDLGRLVFIDRDRGIVVRNLGGGGERLVSPWPDDAANPVLDARRKRLAYRTDAGTFVLDLENGRHTQLGSSHGRPIGFDPRGRLVVARSERTEAALVLLDGDRERSILAGGPAVAFAGDAVWLSEQRFAIATFRFQRPRLTMRVIAIDGSKPRLIEQVAGGWPLLASPDGRELLYSAAPAPAATTPSGSRAPEVTAGAGPPQATPGAGPGASDERLKILRLSTGASRTAGPRGTFRAAALSRSREAALLGTGRRAGVWTYDAVDERGRRVADVRATAIAWTAEGSHLLYVNRRGIWMIDDARDQPRNIVGPVAEGFVGAIAGM
jgi:hypothetical protein